MDEDMPETDLSGNLNDIKFNDDMLAGGSTHVILRSSIEPPYTPEYRIDTLLILSEKQRKAASNGIYSDNRVTTLLADLKNQHLEAVAYEPELPSLKTNGKEIHIINRNVVIRVKFGPHDQGFNKRISLGLERVPGLDVSLIDEQTFIEQASFYANVYSKLVPALYRERGLVSPARAVLLKTPTYLRDIHRK